MKLTYNKIFQASLLVAISGILYGFLGFLGTGIMRENMAISTMLFWRFLIAGSWMFCFTLKKKRVQEKVNYLDKNTLFFIFFLGAIGYAGSSQFYFVASQYTGTGLAMVIFFCYPIIVAFTSWLIHKEQLNLSLILTLLIMIPGFILLQYSATYEFNMMGIFFGIVAAGCYAFYVMGSKRITAHIQDANILTTLVCLGCAFIFFILSLTSHCLVFPVSVKTWAYLLALGIFATALPIQLMLKGLQYVSSMRASIISVLEPLVTVFVGVMLLDETISTLQLLGAFIILSSALLVQFQKDL